MEPTRTILVIEDDPEQRELFTTVLQRAGYNVITRGDALSGLRWLEQILPDLIMLDIMLPGIDGVEMLHQIRESPNGRDVPVIIATAKTELNQATFREYAISRLLFKPLLPSDLLIIIEEVLDGG